MTQDREELKRLAEAAGEGVWQADESVVEYAEAPGIPIAMTDPEGMYPTALGLTYAAYIAAANPATILSLLSDLEAMQEALKEAEAENTRWLLRFDDIREASGVGALPMLSDLPAAIKAKIDHTISKEPEA